MRRLPVFYILIILTLGLLAAVKPNKGFTSIHYQQTVLSYTATQTASPFPSPSPQLLTYDQALTTYSNISTEVMKSVDRVLELTKWIIAGIFSIIGLSGTAILYISRTTGQARDSSISSAKAAEESKKHIEKVEEQVRDTLNQFQTTQADIVQVKRQTDMLQRDLSRAAYRLTTLADVDSYSMRLFNTNDEIRKAAIKSLIELSKDGDSIIRYKSIRAFSMMCEFPDYSVDKLDPVIVKILEELAQNDSEAIVRLEANRIISMFKEKFSKNPLS